MKDDILYDYEQMVRESDIHPKILGLEVKTLGLCAEAGEVAGKINKLHRDRGGVLDAFLRKNIIKELGDTLWFITAIAEELGSSLEEIMEDNTLKIRDRMDRGVLKGSGDDR